MNGFVVVGLLLIVMAAGFYIWQNPGILGQIANFLNTSERSVRAATREFEARQSQSYSSQSAQPMNFGSIFGQPARPSSQDSTIEQQVLDLRVGETFTLDPSGGSSVTGIEYMVAAVGKMLAMNRQGREFMPNGNEYPYIIAPEVILLNRPDGWYYFMTSDAIVLNGEAVRAFYAEGDAFSQKGQQPGSHSFVWEGHTLSVQDVGYMKFVLQGGESDLKNGEMVKYMLAETPDHQTFYVEDPKTGTDRVWIGRKLGMDLQGFVTEVLRASR